MASNLIADSAALWFKRLKLRLGLNAYVKTSACFNQRVPAQCVGLHWRPLVAPSGDLPRGATKAVELVEP